MRQSQVSLAVGRGPGVLTAGRMLLPAAAGKDSSSESSDISEHSNSLPLEVLLAKIKSFACLAVNVRFRDITITL